MAAFAATQRSSLHEGPIVSPPHLSFIRSCRETAALGEKHYVSFERAIVMLANRGVIVRPQTEEIPTAGLL